MEIWKTSVILHKIKTAVRHSLSALAIITVIFLAVISPWKGLSLFTFPLIMFGIALWISSVIFLIRGLADLKNETYPRTRLFLTIVSVMIFLPVGYAYMSISGIVRTRITIDVVNQLGMDLQNVSIYGAGDLFVGTDTLNIATFKTDQKIRYQINPSTKPQKGGGKKGNVVMAYEKDGTRIIKTIAGEFSVYPLNIQQEWEVIINQEFLNRE
jgi:dipeptide/tripeptide permease